MERTCGKVIFYDEIHPPSYNFEDMFLLVTLTCHNINSQMINIYSRILFKPNVNKNFDADLEKINHKINKFIELHNCKICQPTFLSHNMLIAAKSPHDGLWYRAVVLDTNSEFNHKYKIKFIDYGDVYWLDIINIRLVDCTHFYLEFQSLEMILTNLIIMKDKHPFVIEYMKSFNNKCLIAKIDFHSKIDDQLFVTLFDYDVQKKTYYSINDQLIAFGYAKKIDML